MSKVIIYNGFMIYVITFILFFYEYFHLNDILPDSINLTEKMFILLIVDFVGN